MQTVASYLLERRDDLQWPEARAEESARLKAVVRSWLESKGSAGLGSEGTYQPEDGSSGRFSIHSAIDELRSWWMLQLDEETSEGRRFSVGVSITAGSDRVSVYIKSEAGWATARIMPASVDARCPRIVRELLGVPGIWYHGSSILRQHLTVSGFDSGEGLAAEISHPSRAVPLIVVSTEEGRVALPGLDTSLADDLAGIANVVTVDDAAAWALTDILGVPFSCYWGAVRLYWPHFSTRQDRFFHPLWTAERLRLVGDNPVETRDRFRRQLRGILFRAAALSVTQPREIDEIQDSDERRTVTGLRQRASSLEEYEQLADSYAVDNEQLRKERASLRADNEELQAQVGRLEGDKQALLAHLRAAKPSAENAEPDADAIDSATDGDDIDRAPMSEELRFYKKVHSRPAYDVMVRVQDCGCNNWQGAHAADKARKGIARLENGRDEWQSLQHCASCTGGGMWRVRW